MIVPCIFTVPLSRNDLKLDNSTRQDTTSMNLVTKAIICDAVEQFKLIKLLGCKHQIQTSKALPEFIGFNIQVQTILLLPHTCT